MRYRPMNVESLRVRALVALGLLLPACHASDAKSPADEEKVEKSNKADDKKNPGGDETVLPLPGPPCPKPEGPPDKIHWGPYCRATPTPCGKAAASAPKQHYPAPYDRCAPQAGGAPYGSRFSKEATDEARKTDPESCCYVQVEVHPMGRPLRQDGIALLPALDSDGCHPVAERYRAMAAVEASSVAAFAVLIADMRRCDAPWSLIEAARDALEDEQAHTRSALAIAKMLDGRDVALGPLPGRGPVSVATLVREAVIDGCFGESVGALEAATAARTAKHLAIVAHHARVAEDEARHAELAFRWVAWLLDRFPSEAIPAVEAALIELASARIDARPEDEGREDLGLLGREARVDIAGRVLDEAVRGPLERACRVRAAA